MPMSASVGTAINAAGQGLATMSERAHRGKGLRQAFKNNIGILMEYLSNAALAPSRRCSLSLRFGFRPGQRTDVYTFARVARDHSDADASAWLDHNVFLLLTLK